MFSLSFPYYCMLGLKVSFEFAPVYCQALLNKVKKSLCSLKVFASSIDWVFTDSQNPFFLFSRREVFSVTLRQGATGETAKGSKS